MNRWAPPLVLIALAGCGGPQSALDAHGQSAEHLRSLILWIVGLCSIVWMLVMIALIWSLARSSRAPGRPATERSMTRAVGAGVAVTVVVIAGFTIASFYVTRALGDRADADIIVKVRGQQWWWQIQYLDPDPAKAFDTANEIRIPVGRDVRLLLESPDVIHSFWVPSLAGKLDLVPGRSNAMTIRADRAGTYRGQCAEFCGLQHGHMAFLVIAEDDASFEKWRAAQAQDAAAPIAEDAVRGQAVFLARPCAACHTVRGTPAAGTTGPDLTHVGDRETIGAGLFENTRGSLAAWIADPQTAKPGNNMPLVPLTAEELRQVSAYMASLK
jgi:cytochrome c oxidase subunit 2